MNLKKLLTIPSKVPEQEYFLALEIHESLIKTAVWKVESSGPSIVSLGSFELWDSEESLLNGVDASLTQATKNLTQKPIKVILGLPEPWLENDKIHPTKTGIIKRLLTELGLKPMGLVTSTQAIIHHLKKKEGVPPSAILLEIYPDKVTVAVVKLGKVKAIEEVGRSGEISNDVQEGLVRLELEQLPPRFILTNGSNLENEQQQLLSYPWQEKLPFLHLPKVEVLPAEFSIEAIALAGGSEAIGSLGIAKSSSPKPEKSPEPQPAARLSDLGFHIEDKQEQPEPHIQRPPEPEIKTKAEILKQQPLSDPQNRKNPTSVLKDVLSALKTKLRPKKNQKISIPVLVTIILLAPILMAVSYFTLASAQVNIMVEKTPLSQNIDIYFGQPGPQNSISLPANIQPLSASVSESISTTGETLVGEKATGTITLYNRTNKPITIKSGTKIESDNLTFLINSSVKVASKSANIMEGTEEFGRSPGVSVTAASIGTRYNLSKGSQFSVANYSKSIIYAVSENDFTGGSSKTVKAVSEEDQNKLLDIATQKIISQINSEVKKQDPNLSSLVVGKVTYPQKKFSKKVGNEADTVKLDLTGQVKVLLYSPSEIINQISNKVVPSSNPGMKLLPDQTNIEILPPSEAGGDSYKAQANIKGLLIPIINKDRYVSQLGGKSVKKLQNILKTIPGYKGAKITIRPKIPFLSAYIPLSKKRIAINITVSK